MIHEIRMSLVVSFGDIYTPNLLSPVRPGAVARDHLGDHEAHRLPHDHAAEAGGRRGDVVPAAGAARAEREELLVGDLGDFAAQVHVGHARARDRPDVGRGATPPRPAARVRLHAALAEDRGRPALASSDLRSGIFPSGYTAHISP